MSGHPGPGGPQTRLEFGAPPASGEASPVRLEVEENGLGWVVFDVPGKKVNTLSTGVIESLRDLMDVAVRKNVSGLVFVSDKPGTFIAGADVEEFESVSDPRLAMEKAAYAQAVFETVARFSRPTVCVISGACLGGGYELALACDIRIAENRPEVRIGLPEIKLGIIPGFGGTQRLPRRVGIPVALDIILAGKTLPAKPAFRRGMVDALVPEGRGREIARELLTGARTIEAHRPAFTHRALAAVPWVRNQVFSRARQTLARKARREHYPAPYQALESVSAGFSMGEVAAYRNEARIVGDLLVSETAQNLIWLFRNSGRAKEPENLDLAEARPVKKTAVVGAGIMGGGIAWLAGEKNIPIRIKDIAPEALEHAMETAGSLWTKQVKRKRLTPRERDRRVEKLSFTLDYSGFRNVDLVVEAVVENLDVKHKVLAEVENEVSEQTVLATNTSSLRVADIVAPLRHPERFVGLHFFNPVHRMPLVEVVAGPRSASWAVATAYDLALRLGKTPILVQDGPGFLVNRLLSFYLGEALHLFEKGADPVRVDRRLVDFGMPMGPFELLDQIGLDVADKVTHVIEKAYGDRLPSQATLGRMVEEGRLGKKTGDGFYRYENGKKGDPSTAARAAAGNPSSWVPGPEEILDRLVLPMINEAARCLEESLVRRPLDVDLGMVMGTGFPPFRGGLLRYADQRGVRSIVERLEILAESADRRFAPSEPLRGRSQGFYSV